MLEFIFGRPKSGKTAEIIKRIKECVDKNQRTYLLVPEQQVHISETMLAEMMPSSWRCFEVISFSRLTELVFASVGGITDKSVDENVKHLILWYSANTMPEADLSLYRESRSDVSFSNMLLSTITELSAYGITPERLAESADGASDAQFKQKMLDISAIYASFKHNIQKKLGAGIMLKEDMQSYLCEALKESRFFCGANVFIDSFTDFTANEEAILKRIIRDADNTAITISMASRGKKEIYNESIRDTLRSLTSYARDNYIKTVDFTAKARCGGENRALSAIERNIWNFSLTHDMLETIPAEDLSAVNMTRCKSPYEEAEYAAIKILEEHNAGTPFSEMAVIMRDAEGYKGIINSIFDKYHIPYFYSEKTDISATSAARYILASLRAVSSGFRLDDILSIVKTGLCSATDSDCDMFEDYCTSWNINGSGFLVDAFNMNPDGYSITRSKRADLILSAANKVRETIIPPLKALRAKLHSANNTHESIEAICDYIDTTSLAASISSLCEDNLARGEIRECSETLRIYDYIIESLNTIDKIFGEDKLTQGELISAIEIMFSHTDIASVPPIDEYVTVGSAPTLRTENIKSAFVLGLCDGEFPRAVGDGTLISHTDKESLAMSGIKLASTKERLSSDELYFVYRALTTPKDKLYLTFPEASIDGRAKSTSVAWRRILFILGKSDDGIPKFDSSRLRDYLCDSQGATDTLEAEADNTDNIDPHEARLIFGDKIHLSKSQISTFTLCPYSYWCSNVLHLREGKTPDIKPSEIGTLVHYVLEKYLEENVTADGSVIPKESDEIFKRTSELCEDYIKEIGISPTPYELYSFSRFRDSAYMMLKNIDEEFRSCDFKIIAREEKISESQKSLLSPLRISVPVSDDFTAEVILGGNVDRIDALVREGDPNVYVRIIDYKTGKDSFNIDKISDGHDIQLPIYLFAATSDHNQSSELFASLTDGNNEGSIVPVSALFLSIKEECRQKIPFRSGFILNDRDILLAANHSLDDKFLVGTAKKGDDGTPANKVDSEKMNEIKATVESTVSSVASSIYSGKAEKRPSSDACRYCKIKNQCPVAVQDKSF